jgi:ABC-type Fe3+/spermidine/putrescine transport system ATPase subunit
MTQRRISEVNAVQSKVKVSVCGVSKRFGDFFANRTIDLDIRTGEFLTLLGPSGCGKTTLMRIIAGLEQCDEGRVLIDGRDVTAEPPRQRRLGMVFQGYSLFPHMSVRDNIAYGLRVQGLRQPEIEARVGEMLELVSMPDFAARRPSELSGGQQQRVALARALATRPSLLMLDEPLAALDLKLRRQLQAELKRIHRQTGVTFLFVTHDQEEALFLSDRIAVMREGRVEQLDAPEIVYAQPATAYVADFIGDVTLLACEATEDGRAALLCAWPGTPPIELPEGTPSGRFSLVVRPEHVVLDASPEAGLAMLVDEVVNEGSTMLVLLHAGELKLKARVMGRPRFPISPGVSIGARIEGATACLGA